MTQYRMSLALEFKSRTKTCETCKTMWLAKKRGESCPYCTREEAKKKRLASLVGRKSKKDKARIRLTARGYKLGSTIEGEGKTLEWEGRELVQTFTGKWW